MSVNPPGRRDEFVGQRPHAPVDAIAHEPHPLDSVDPSLGGFVGVSVLQDKVWLHGPRAEPWEVYTVKAAPQSTFC